MVYTSNLTTVWKTRTREEWHMRHRPTSVYFVAKQRWHLREVMARRHTTVRWPTNSSVPSKSTDNSRHFFSLPWTGSQLGEKAVTKHCPGIGPGGAIWRAQFCRSLRLVIYSGQTQHTGTLVRGPHASPRWKKKQRPHLWSALEFRWATFWIKHLKGKARTNVPHIREESSLICSDSTVWP